MSELAEALKDHGRALENLRRVIAEVYPDATRWDRPYFTIRSHMAALRSFDAVLAEEMLKDDDVPEMGSEAHLEQIRRWIVGGCDGGDQTPGRGC